MWPWRCELRGLDVLGNGRRQIGLDNAKGDNDDDGDNDGAQIGLDEFHTLLFFA